MKKNTIAIRREDLNKQGEQRVAIKPIEVKKWVEAGHEVLIQPAIHPETGERKRAIFNVDYEAVGARISEDISAANIVFGLKEIGIPFIENDKCYFTFSHTHKGQVKNKEMLKAFAERNCTLIDYELVVNPEGQRIITAFTYFAGYAGMIDTLWTVGERLKLQGISHPFAAIPQGIAMDKLDDFKQLLREIGQGIQAHGTPSQLPPMINLILGEGKTSTGAQEIFNILPVKQIKANEIKAVFESGDRHQVYQCVLGIEDIFRPKADINLSKSVWNEWSKAEKEQHYFNHPEDFESNIDQFLPYVSILMNCILWGPQFPRVFTKDLAKSLWKTPQNLIAIGDITCDPNGSIEFSQETWINDPVFIFNPETGENTLGMEGDGIAVMAVTNLPCEFSKDASAQFSDDISPLLARIASADFEGSLADSGFPIAIQKATILWKGEFTDNYAYMSDFIG